LPFVVVSRIASNPNAQADDAMASISADLTPFDLEKARHKFHEWRLVVRHGGNPLHVAGEEYLTVIEHMGATAKR
jgi:hypothetical protein